MRRELYGVMDCFASLQIPRAPYADAAAVTDAFHHIAATVHPDAPDGSNSKFADLNLAWQTLREPASCLRHYLELEFPGVLAGAEHTPPALGDLFMDIASARQGALTFASKRDSAASPLNRALLEPERIAHYGKIESLISEVAARKDAAIEAIRARHATPKQLADLLATITFLGKWMAQLRESALALA